MIATELCQDTLILFRYIIRVTGARFKERSYATAPYVTHGIFYSETMTYLKQINEKTDKVNDLDI